MKRNRWFASVLACGFAAAVHAQAPGTNPATRPAFSPWLNLNRSGASAAGNYFGLVRPDFRYNSSIQQLQQQTLSLQQQQNEAKTATDLPATGHVSGFLNHTKYFMNRGGGTPSGGGQTATAGKQQSTPQRGSTRH